MDEEVTDGNSLPDCIKKKIQEFCDEYNGCPCLECRERYLRFNKEVIEEFIERCEHIIKDYFEQKGFYYYE